jgi:transcriptional regulator with XRE-family HTH domain
VVYMGEQLRQLLDGLKRKHQGKYSQEKFSAEIGVTQGTLSKLLNDETPVQFSLAIYISKKHKRPDFFIKWISQLQEQGLNELLTA